ncbi:MAG: ParB/RepB/Spo0J family partition protein [Prevotellaceae bacterium]|jgi:ParB family chromosome partitioning protein|nr:ParB/RepB/Spo0J family partition protein [Prevotellaceae bacterium]
MKKQAALGRGLGALMGDAGMVNPHSGRMAQHPEVQEELPHEGVLEVSIDAIQPNPDQPRTDFDKESLHDLAISIKTLGLIQPITVREIKSGHYQIIAGERRFRASQLAGLTTVPVYIRAVGDEELLKLALIENIHREDLNPIEVAISFKRLVDEWDMTQETLSEQVGKKRATVANYLRLLSLPGEIQVFVRDGKLSMGHARALLGINDEKLQLKIARKIIDEDLSVRKVEEIVKKQNTPASAETPEEAPAEPEHPEIYSQMVEFLGGYFNNVNVKRNEKGEGKIIIHFSKDEEVAHFLQKFNEQQT